MTTSDAPSTRRDGPAPTVTDLEARLVRERARSRLFDQAIAAVRVGRFTLHERLGSGGMGTVYAAYDAELERKVAIKFLAPDLDDHAILKQEARALARLSHPNVVAVHEVGEHQGRLFLAMEFVVGQTLRFALRDRARPGTAAPGVREVVNLYLQAGRGLAAAHAAALVHGDFKPDNVLLGDDGRVRVLDFGLARAQGGAEPAGAEPGRIVGTPAYMAPEQFIGGGASQHSDQYSFCVALHEGLYGRRPFEAPDLAALKEAVVAGVLPDPPSGDVPAWVRAIVVRGLARDPAARWPDMDALLAALSRDPAVVRRRVALGVGAVALVAGSVSISDALRGPPDALCTGAEARLAGVWDTPRKAAVKSALLDLGRPYAPATWAHVERTLDAFAAGLVATHDEVCARTHARGERSETQLDLSMACLDRRTEELKALVDVLATADDEVLARADTAVDALRDPVTCEDTARLALPLPPPDDPEALRGVQATERALAQLGALRSAGRYREAHAGAAAIVDQARATGHRPTLAEALEMQATLLADTGDVDAAIAVGHEATYAAESGHHDEVLARVRTRLVHWIGYGARREAEAEAMARQAQATIDRLGGDPVLAADLAKELPSVKQAADDWEDSHRLALAALARIEAAYGPDAPDTADALHNLGITEQTLGRPADALPRHDRSIAIWTAAFGPEHPEVAFGYSARANALGAMGRLDEALAGQLRVQAIWEGAFGREHPRVAATINNIGVYQLKLGKLDEARETLTRGVALWQQLDPEGPRMAEILTTMGELHHAEGDHVAALAAHQRASKIATASEGDGGATAAKCASNVGLELLELDRAAEAVPIFKQARAALTAAVGAGDPMLLGMLDGLAEALARTGDRDGAADCYDQELAILRAGPPNPAAVARVERLLAEQRSAP